MNEAQHIDQLHFSAIKKWKRSLKNIEENNDGYSFLPNVNTFFQNLSIYLMSIQNVLIQAYIESTGSKSLLKPIYIWHSFWCTKIGVNSGEKLNVYRRMLWSSSFICVRRGGGQSMPRLKENIFTVMSQ